MIMPLTPFCSNQSKWFNYGKCFLWSYKSWFSVSCTFKIKIWLINNASVHPFASHVTIGYNIVLFCLTLQMIKFYHSIDIIFNISSMYNNMKIKLHNTTRASEQLVRDPIGGVSLNIIPYVKIVIHVGLMTVCSKWKWQAEDRSCKNSVNTKGVVPKKKKKPEVHKVFNKKEKLITGMLMEESNIFQFKFWNSMISLWHSSIKGSDKC